MTNNVELIKRLKKAQDLRQNNLKKSLSLITDIIKEADSNNNNKIACEARIYMGNTLTTTGNYKDAMRYLTEALSIVEASKNPAFLWKIQNSMAIIHSHAGRLEQAVLLFEKASKNAIKAGDQLSQATILINMGNIYGKQNLINKAIENFQHSLECACKVDDLDLKIISLVNLGESYNAQKEWNKAIKSLDQAQELSEKNNMQLYLQSIYLEKGRSLLNINKKEIAEDLFNRSITLITTVKDKVLATNAYLARFDFYFAEHNPKCKKDLSKAITIADTLKDPTLQRNAYERAWIYYKSKNQWKKALTSYETYFKYYKILQDKDIASRMFNIEIQGLQKAHNRIKVINSIGKKITAELNLEKVLDLVYTELNTLIDATIFGIGNFDSKSRKINYALFIESGKRMPISSKDIDEQSSLAKWVIKNKKNINIQDSFTELQKYNITNIPNSTSCHTNYYPSSLLYAPLMIYEEVIGIITVQTYKKNAYSTEDSEIFLAIASYVAIALKNAQQASLIEIQNSKLKLQSETDELTGAFNRRYLMNQYERMWEWGKRSKSSISLMIIDIDFFKNVNDTYGHLSGDACLIHLVKIMKAKTHRHNDIVARYGGEEFIIILGATPREGALKVAEDIRSSIEKTHIKYKKQEYSVTVSIGIYCTNLNAKTKISQTEVLSRIDKALYKAKSNGRNQVAEWTEEM